MSADSYADLLERLFGDYEDRHTIAVIEKVGSQSRAQLAGQSPPGAQLELLDRLARQRLERAVANGVPARWVTGDEVYGQHSKLRVKIEELGLSYVLAVPVNQHVIAAGPREGQEFRADALIAALPAQAWRRRSAGKGAKEDRLYDWARTPIHGINFPDSSYWLLARRSISDPTDLAYYLCHAPARTGLTELVTVAGTRWAIEETFQTSKGQTGLDHYQVRQYTGWYRHITLSMLAHAFLTVTRSKKGARNPATTHSSP